ncbi:helix-turn-helix domain-containing protein [Roseivivax jejudonensis]|uniref:helix-turn-helix domain-containing protein n=1 Tax=Roseivivax jejudonensis TaxID=1529041 RepID=UPI003520AA4F
MNTTPKRYYAELRLDRARLLFLQTEMSVSEVAFACGFENPSYFSWTYRAHFGTSPRAQSFRIA